MKKLLSITLAVVLVLALGSLAFANERPLKGVLEIGIPVKAEIGPYAEVSVVKNIEFGVLDGGVGIYVVNGGWFYDEVKGMFENAVLQKNDNPGGWGTFQVEANTDVNIAVSFDDQGWMGSKTVFGVHRGAKGTPWWRIDYDAWAGNFDLGDKPGSFRQLYEESEHEPGARLYDVNGAIYIKSISQQEAQAYSAKLVVTISK